MSIGQLVPLSLFRSVGVMAPSRRKRVGIIKISHTCGQRVSHTSLNKKGRCPHEWSHQQGNQCKEGKGWS